MGLAAYLEQLAGADHSVMARICASSCQLPNGSSNSTANVKTDSADLPDRVRFQSLVYVSGDYLCKQFCS